MTVRFLKPPTHQQSLVARRRASALNSGGYEIGTQVSHGLTDDLFYRGRSDRISRYAIYDSMDLDVDIGRALDMIAEHCTNDSIKTKTPFEFSFDDDEIGTDDSDALSGAMYQWEKVNHWSRTMFRVIRNLVKYGDVFFIRDPKTYRLHQVAARQVKGAYVDRDNRTVEAYHFTDLNFTIDEVMDFSVPQTTTGASYSTATGSLGAPGELRREALVLAQHVIHLSTNEGRETGGNGQHDDIWPFGESFLEQVYKDYRLRAALETAAVIHRMQRAPSRRVWYIGVGRMRDDRVGSFMKRFKDELLNKRVPQKHGGQDQLDSVYNPVSQMEDVYIPVMKDRENTRVETLEGQQWNGLADLEYFNSKLIRGLRIPTSFMLGPEEGGSGAGASFNDGKTGTAYIQELQFAKFCRRIQDLAIQELGTEFKRFVKVRGVTTPAGDYDLIMTPPINFEEYRQGALENDRLQRVSQANGFGFLSKRYVLTRYGGFTKDEILENERLWAEENLTDAVRGDAQAGGFGGMGVGSGISFPDSGFGGGDVGPMDGMPGMDDVTGGMNQDAAPATGGTPAPATGGAPAPGIESRYRGGSVLMERMLSQYGGRGLVISGRPSQEPKARIMEERYEDRSPDPEEEDRLFWAGDGEPIDSKPKLTMREINRLRKDRERSRRELVARLELVSRQYAGGSGPSF